MNIFLPLRYFLFLLFSLFKHVQIHKKKSMNEKEKIKKNTEKTKQKPYTVYNNNPYFYFKACIVLLRLLSYPFIAKRSADKWQQIFQCFSCEKWFFFLSVLLSCRSFFKTFIFMFFDKRVEHVWISIYAPKRKEDVELEKKSPTSIFLCLFSKFYYIS